MRKKQLYAILLAGALAAGSTPTAVWAAEDTVSEAAPASDMTDVSSEVNGQPADIPSEPTAAPTEEAPAQPTEAPAEPTVAPADGETSAPTDTPSEPAAAPAEETPVPQEVETENAGDPQDDTDQDAEQTDTGISIVTIGSDGTEIPTYYNTLQEAVDAVATTGDSSNTTVIRITQMLSLTDTVAVSGKKVCIQAAAADVSIVRGDSGSGVFDGDMFAVTGTGSELQFKADEGYSLKIDGDTKKGEETPSAGSIVNVGTGAAFSLSSGVTLTGSNSSADGAAVMNNGGSLVFRGGAVTGNKGAKGAVYTNTDITFQGSVSVKDNTGANLYLDGEAAIVVTGAMSDSSVSFTHGAAADQKAVIKAGATEEGTQLGQEEFKDAADQFAYEGTDYTIELGSDGLTAVLKKAAEPSVSPSPGPIASPTPTPTTKPGEPTATPTPTSTPSFLTYQSGSLKWVDHSTISVGMSTTKDCKWYYFFVDADTPTSTIQGMYDSSRAVNPAKANTSFTIKAENVPETDSWLVVAAKPTSGNVQMRVLKLNSEAFKKKRPAASSTDPSTRAPRTYAVTESSVTGLEEPLKFFPNTFYEFTVTGAGQNDEAPHVSGDERWIPMYWSTSQNPSDNQKNTTWRIGSGSGITQAATYNMYIFFKKQVYNGSEWTDTDVIEYIVTQFRSAEITDEELAELTATPGIDYAGGGTDGYSAELTEAASSKDGGSTSKSAVSTADESPIGTMSALAAFSLAAGGYILMRKRKKEF